jgi:hypothetical protein
LTIADWRWTNGDGRTAMDERRWTNGDGRTAMDERRWTNGGWRLTILDLRFEISDLGFRI